MTAHKLITFINYTYSGWLILVPIIIFILFLSNIACDGSQAQDQTTVKIAGYRNILEATYRGTNERSGVFDDIGVTFPLVEKWKHFSTKQGIDSAPVIAEGLIFFGSSDGYFYALDALNGDERWKFKTGEWILSSATISNGTVYFGSMDGFFYALDAATGQKKWSFTTSRQVRYPEALTPLHSDYGIVGSPVVSDGIVYFGANDGHLYALDASTGEKIWDFTARSAIDVAPAVAEGIVYFESQLDNLYALDAKTGKEIWENKIQNGLGTTPVVSDGIVLYDDSSNLIAYDAHTGKMKWSIEVGIGGGLDGGPAVEQGVAFMGDSTGFYAIDVETGQKKWDNSKISKGTGIPPSIAGDCVYFIDMDANIDILDIQSGELRGRYKLQDKFDPYWKTATPMSIANGIIYIGSKNGNLYAIGGGATVGF